MPETVSSLSPDGTTLRHQSQYSDAPEFNLSTDRGHISSGDFDGEKVFVQGQPDYTDLPQPTATLVNRDPRSAPQVVGIEDGNSPPQAYVVNSDPKSFLQAAGTEDDKEDKAMGAIGGFSSATNTPGISEEEAAAAALPPPRKWYRKRRFQALIAAVILVIIALAVGLGVGLSQRNSSTSDDSNDDSGGPTTGSNSTISCDGGLCPTVLSVTQFDGTLAVFARTSNNRLTVRTLEGDTWSSQWTDLGEASSDSNFVSQPAAISWEADGNGPRLDVFAVGSTDNRVYGSHKVETDGTWSSWTDLGPGAGSPVVACRPREDRIDLWTTDVDSGNVTHNYWFPAPEGEARKRQIGEDEPDEDEPDEEEPDENEDEDGISTTVVPPPAPTSTNNPPPPSPTGGDSSTGNFNTSDGSSWPVINPPLGPVSPNGLAVVCRDTSVMHNLVWYENSTSSSSSPLAWHASYDSSTNSWSSPRSFSASFIGTPSLFSFSDNSIDFFGVDANSSLLHFSWTAGGTGGGFSSLEDLGGDLASMPAAVSPSGGDDGDVVDVVALGSSGRLVHLHFDGQSWADEWEDLGIEARSAPSMTVYDGQITIFALSEQGTLMASSLDDSTEEAEWASLLRTEDLGGDLTLEYYIVDA